MKKQDELLKQLIEMTKDTKAGKIAWEVICQTTEYNDVKTKPQVEEEGEGKVSNLFVPPSNLPP